MNKGKKIEKTKKSRSSGNAQLGIFEIPDVDQIGTMPDGDDDDDLEAELLQLMSGPSAGARTSRQKPPVKPTPTTNLDAMVAASLRDIPSDESVSGDEDDPELLAELNAVTGEEKQVNETQQTFSPPTNEKTVTDLQSLLIQRMNTYKEAEANAKAVGDTMKVRRLGRGLKTLNDLLKKAQNGIPINEDDIPLPVATGSKKPAPTEATRTDDAATGSKTFASSENDDPTPKLRPAPPVPPRTGVSVPGLVDIAGPSSEVKEEDAEKKRALALLTARRDEYKKAALLAKRSGDTQQALAHVKIIKQFEVVIAGVEAGQPADLSTMPPPPPSFSDVPTPVASAQITPAEEQRDPLPPPSQPEISISPDQDSGGFEKPATILEALEQRMAKFKEQEEAGKRDGNASKARRMGRIVKQYQDAIKLHKAGKPFPVDELPTPPGFPPIPVGEETKQEEPPPSSPVAPPRSPSLLPELKVSPSPSPVPPSPEPRVTAPKPHPEASPILPHGQVPLPPDENTGASASIGAAGEAGKKKLVATRQSKQMAVLLARQKQFKEAAVKAKQKGDINQAKEYLRLAKGFDPLIEASNSGLPIDMATIPVPPGVKEDLESSFDIVVLSDCIPGTDSEIYERLLTDLHSQIKMCMETRNHFKSIGDVASANKFEHLAVNTKKDYDTVRTYKSKNDPVPRFRYEKRTFSIVRCNVDLGDNDLELTIVQGINYNVPNPKEVDTYVRYEFPYPNDEIRKNKTGVVWNTNNPSYDAVFLVPIQRSVRAFQRLFKRHAIKMEVWSRGGFLRSDALIGTVNVKLQPLETKCTIHDSFDLMEGRKCVGGKLEVRVRIRHPIQAKQVEHVEEKWLVIL